MSDDNDKTLQVYENHADDYAAANDSQPNAAIKAWLDTALELIPNTGTVLEIGSAHGRDANYIKTKGYTVICTDAAQSFIAMLQEQGHRAHLLNALKDPFDFNQDMILANAVFLHFTPDQLQMGLNKAHKALPKGGILAFSVKKGEGEGWSTNYLGVPRYFCFWQIEPLSKLLERAGFETIQVSEYTSAHQAEWLQFITRK